MRVNVYKDPIMLLPFNNCELHCCSMDGFKGNSEALLSRLSLMDDYFSSRPKVSRYRIWYNVEDTVLTDDTIEWIAKSLCKINDNIIKIAFVGTKKKRRFDKILRNTSFDKPVGYFSDAELAKEWLV